MSIIVQAAAYLSEHSRYLTEALKFEPTEFGTDPKNPTNQKFAVDSDARYTYFMHEGQLFKAFIKVINHDVGFGILNPNAHVDNITSSDFLVGEKSDLKINMISFWSKLLFIFKKMLSQHHYNYLTFSSVEHTAKLYKAFMNNKTFLSLLDDMGFKYSRTDALTNNEYRYSFRNINELGNARDELLARYKVALNKLNIQFPKFKSAYLQDMEEVKQLSDEDLLTDVENLENVTTAREIKEMFTQKKLCLKPYNSWPGLLTNLSEESKEFLK
jgi:hypothetical protein